MIKIPCLFKRDFTSRSHPALLRDVTPGCEWVLEGEGVATQKFDGTACYIKEGLLYARYDAKQGKTPPRGAIPCGLSDPVTGHWPHWARVTGAPEYKWHREAWAAWLWFARLTKCAQDGTYELCGPSINGNPEGCEMHQLLKHGDVEFDDVPRDFDGLRAWLRPHDIEGLVFHHPDGRMAKIRKADYGLPRKP
jgi:hypothetical protein